MMFKKELNTKFYKQIVNLLQQSKESIIRSVNHTMVLTYFEIGRLIVEEEQNGKERADYGKEFLKGLSKELETEFGKGFSVKNLERMRVFYQTYKNSTTLLTIFQNTDSQKDKSNISGKEQSDGQFNLSWSHYLTLMRIDDENERKFYEIEAFKSNWSVRELQRQYNSALCLLDEVLCVLSEKSLRPLRLRKFNSSNELKTSYLIPKNSSLKLIS